MHSRKQRRGRRLLGALTAMLAGVFALQLVGVVPAFANAANPNPDTSGTATVNGDGSVTAKLSGTWTWPGQNCAGRYGEDWAVDWWGVSSSPTPTNSFSLTNASIVPGPGQSTTGTISPYGAIKTPSNNYFHVAQYYSGEDVNSASTCTDTGTGPGGGSQGNWSATATYPSLSDVPNNVCVILYDPHGSEGKPSKSLNDYSTTKDGDNSIQTNKFDPSAGAGFCVQLQVQSHQTIQAEIYKCVGGAPSTKLISAGTLEVPAANLSTGNPLPPTAVAAGSYEVHSMLPSSFQFVACGQTGVDIVTGQHAMQSVNVPAGGAGDAKFYVVATAPPAPGYVEVCKSSANGVSGNFQFTFNGSTITVPAGACSSAIQVPSGQLTITEVHKHGFYMVSAAAQPSSRLVSSDPTDSQATVTIVPGDVSTQTIVTFTNHRTKATVKVCEVAGTGVAQGTHYTFTNSATSEVISVPAGPAPGGYCVPFTGSFAGGANLTVKQQVPANSPVSAITVAPSSWLVGTPDLTNGKVVVDPGSGVVDVTFTNTGSS